jgi:hypothetical protein
MPGASGVAELLAVVAVHGSSGGGQEDVPLEEEATAGAEEEGIANGWRLRCALE